jgi:hypothetical protein
MIGRIGKEVLSGEQTLDAALTAANITHGIISITGDNIKSISPYFATDTLYLLVGIHPRVTE